ncbi:LysM domain-containing protein [Massilia sp. B-10]|nr:LysM domain-containing protein [Massilia sp. B-10]UUZ53280.1 LysM domain-containing protein [Massilia sp. H-1]
MFPPSSRYVGIETARIESPDGRQVVYLRRRFVPPPDDGPAVALHSVVEGDRLDNITARYLGDPEQFWRVCDSNAAMEPQELTDEVGRLLRITFPRSGAI